MRIDFLRMKNFGNILSATGKHDISLSFPNNGKRVVLLVGENGSGKSSIMDQLHPFIENSTTRTFKDLLIDSDKEGHTLEAYKEIHIVNNGTVYVVKHIVDSKGRVKSYIERDGEELNPNGNVTPFKEIVEMELHVTLDFMKLLSLGTNSRTFIKMSSGERKRFLSDIMREVELYNRAFKNVSERARLSKRLLQSVVNDMSKNEVAGGETYLIELRESLKAYEEDKEESLSTLASSKAILERVAPSGIQELQIKVDQLNKRNKELQKELPWEGNESEDEVRDKIHNVENLVHQHEKSLQSITHKRDLILNKMDANNKEIDRLTMDIKRLSHDREENALYETLSVLKKDIDEAEKLFGGKELTYTKNEMMDLIRLAKKIEDLINNIYHFDDRRMVDVCDAWIQNRQKSYEVELSEEFDDLYRQEQKIKSNEDVKRARKSLDGKPTPIIFHVGNIHDCPFEDFYNEVMGFSEEDKRSISEKLHVIEKDRTEIEEALAINSTISAIKMLLDAHELTINKMPFNFFDMKNILVSIKQSKPFYNEDIMTEYISLVETYERYIINKRQLVEVEAEVKTVKKTNDFIQDLTKPMVEKKNENDILADKRTRINEVFESEQAVYNKTNKTLTKLNDKLTAMIHHRNIVDEREYVNKELTKLSSRLDEAKTHTSIVLRETKLLDKSRHAIEQLRYNINNSNRKYENYKELKERQEELIEDYELTQLVRKALSSVDGDGIPLVYMQIYMAQTLVDINDILDIVYDGKLRVPRFDIGDRDFNIPYINNGVEISDVNQCSQGEETFLSIAISFAFVSRTMQSEDSFNIPRFDEVDGPLDAYKRERFLDIINLQIDNIKAEQIFIISHNKAFDSYPVNVVELTEGLIDDYSNKTLIEMRGR